MNEIITSLEQWFTVDRTLMLAYIFACAVQAMPDGAYPNARRPIAPRPRREGWQDLRAVPL